MKQEVYYTKSAGAKASSKTPAYKQMPRGCKACHDRGEADSCRHCWKCADATHFAYNCPQPQENSATAKGQPVADQIVERESHHCNGCLRTESTEKFLVCGGCKATRYYKKSCQIKDWQNHKAICLAIQKLSDNIYENELGKGDSEDKQAFVSHLTPKDQVKVSKLLGRKCLINCKLNGVELTALFYTGAQVSIVSLKQLRKHFPSVEIKDIKDLLESTVDLEITTASGTKLPYSCWVKIDFELINSGVNLTNALEVPMLVTEFSLDQPIIGYNVIEEMVKNNNAPDEQNLLLLLSASFPGTSSSNLNAFVIFIQTKYVDEICVVKNGKRNTNVPSDHTVKVPCGVNTGLIDEKTPVMFEPDVGSGFHPGLEVHESLLTLEKGNCSRINLQIVNKSNHDIILRNKSLLGSLHQIRSVTPVDLNK